MAFDLLLKKGSTSQIIEVMVRDATTGQGKTGLAAASVNYMSIKRGASNAVGRSGLASMALGTWVSEGWCEINATSLPGLYQFGLPDAALTGTDELTLIFRISGCLDKVVKIVLTGVDLQDAAAAGISRLDAAVGGVAASVWTQTARTLTGTINANVVSFNGTSCIMLGDGTNAYPQVAAAHYSSPFADNLTSRIWGCPSSSITMAGSIGAVLKSPLTAAEVWSHSARALTDKAGFSLNAAQAFDNSGQTTAQPADLRKINGTNAQSNVSGGYAYLYVCTSHWGGTGNGVGLISGLPSVAIAGASAAGRTAIAEGVWNAAISSYNSADSFGELGNRYRGMIELDGSTYRYTAGALEQAPSGGSGPTAAEIWSYASRSLTDKTGFVLAAVQSFDNGGQVTVVPANVKQWKDMASAVETVSNYPLVTLAAASATGHEAICNAVWDGAAANHTLAGSFGRLLADHLDARISTRLAASSYVAPDNASISGIKAQTDQLVFVSGDLRVTLDGEVVDASVDTAGIAAAVWSAGGRSLTDKAGFTLGDGSITAATFSPGAIDATVAPNLDAAVSSRMAAFAYVAPDNAGIAAVKAQTDQIVFAPHGDGTFDVRSMAVNNVAVDPAAVAASVWSAAARSLTDKAGFSLGDGSISTATFVAGAIDATVAPNLDAPVSSRMASFAYVAPDNAGIAAIKAQTDQLVFVSGDVRATLDGEVVSAGVDNASIAASVWANATRTITGGALDSVTSVANAVTTTDAAAITAIKTATDKIVFVDHGDGTWDVRVPIPTALTAADVWAHGTRSLTDKAGFALADGSITTATFTAGAVSATVAPSLDAAVSSRMASFVYVAPDNAGIALSVAGIAAVKLQTDKLHFTPHGDGTFDVQASATATAVVDNAAVASAVWASASRTITGGTIDTNNDKAGYSLAAAEQAAIVTAVWNAAGRSITGGTIDTNRDKTGYSLAADQYTHIAGAIWTDTERGQIRSALGLSGARTATDGDGITDSIYRIASKLRFNSQSDVIASLDGETVHLNPMQNFNNIGQRDEVPAQDSMLRLRLTDARTAKIDNLDAPISTRSSHSPGDVWSFNHRTLTSFGTLVSDTATAVWTFGSRTLTGFGSLVGDIWSAVSRTITAGTVDLSAQAKADVRAAAEAALVDYGPLTYSDAAFDRDQIIDQVEAVLAAVQVKPDAAAIAAAVDALLTTNHGSGDWRDTSHGVGPVAYTVRVTDGINPIAMASVRMSVGPVGISLITAADGTAAFNMQPGTYTLRIAKLGYSGHTATVTINVEPTAQSYDAQVNPLVAISAPPDPGKCTAYLTTYDGVGNKESGVSIELRLVFPPPGNAQAFSAKPWTVLSDGDGVVQVALLKNAAYQARRGSGEWHLVKTTNADTIPLPTVLSHPNR